MEQVELPFFEFGDAVQIAEDLVEMHKLQKNYGEWADEMSDVSVWYSVDTEPKVGVVSYSWPALLRHNF